MAVISKLASPAAATAFARFSLFVAGINGGGNGCHNDDEYDDACGVHSVVI
jgi:hypothetical protein